MSIRTKSWLITPHTGIIAPAALRAVAEYGLSRGDGVLHLNARQQLVVRGSDCAETHVDVDSRVRIEHLVRGLPPNVTTTLPALGAGEQTPWLARNIFEQVWEMLSAPRPFTVGFADPRQRLLPMLGNAINFIAGEVPDTWNVALASGRDGYTLLDGVIVTTALERFLAQTATALHRDRDSAAAALSAHMERANAAPNHKTDLGPVGPAIPSPSGGAGSGVLEVPAPLCGLPCGFVHDLCVFALARHVAHFGLTPWRSLLIHALPAGDGNAVQRIFARHRVPERAPWAQHGFMSDAAAKDRTAATLAAQLHDVCPSAGGLSLGIVCRGEPLPDADIAVVVERPSVGSWRAPRYSMFTRSRRLRFEPAAQYVSNRRLAEHVLRCMDALLVAPVSPVPSPPAATPVSPRDEEWTCPACESAYAPRWGDPFADVAPGTAFHALPNDWGCPVCGESKWKFVATAHASGF